MITSDRFSGSSLRRLRPGGAFRLAAVVVLVSLAAAHAGDIQVDRVRSGSAEFSHEDGHTKITCSDGTIIQYNRFDVPEDSSVQFVQPGETSRVLNRISSAEPSQIMGTLTANGIVYFVNPAGVTFGPDSVVDVARLHAAAGDITDEDFLDGIDRFTTEGVVESHGTILARDGIHLMGREVANTGLLVSDRGIVTLSSGSRVYLSERDSRVRVLVDDLDASTGRTESGSRGESSQSGVGVDNQGTVRGDEVVFSAGDVYSMAIRNTGEVRARDGGDVTFSGDGAVVQAGDIDASDHEAGGTGGEVKLLGETVIHSGDTDVSGHSGGGRVLIGGAAEGAGPERNALGTFVSSSSNVNADAVAEGDGGEVVVWSDLATYSYGQISARGGAEGGDGGFVETSSADYMDLSGSPDVSAAAGRGGQWLIDPSNVRIIDGPTEDVETPLPGSYDLTDQLDLTAEMLGLDLDDPDDQQEWDNLQAFTPDMLMESTAEGATIDVADIRTALMGNAVVTVKTGDAGDEDGNISFEADLDYQGIGEGELALWAHKDIDITGRIYDSFGGNSLTLRLITGRDGDPGGMVTVDSEIDTGYGDFIVHGSAAGSGFTLAEDGSIAPSHGRIWISVADDIDLNQPGGIDGAWDYGLKLRSFDGDVHLPALTPSWVDAGAGGNIRLYGDIDAMVGDVDFHTPVVLEEDTSIDGVNITFHDTIDGAHTLQLEATNGDIIIDGVAGGVEPLHGLVADSWQTVAVDAIHTADGGITFSAPDGLTLRGDLTTVAGADGGDVSLDGFTPVSIAGDISIDTNHATGDSGNVDFDEMTGLDADSAEFGRSLTIDAGDGLVSLRPDPADLIGQLEPLESLAVTSAGLVRLPSMNLLEGGASVTADDIELHGYVFTGVGDAGGDVTLSGDVALESEQAIIFTATFDPITGQHGQRGGTVTIDGSVSSDLDSVLSIQTGGGDIGIDATVTGLSVLECDARFDRPEEVDHGNVVLDGTFEVSGDPGVVDVRGHQVDILGTVDADGEFEVDGHDVLIDGPVTAGDIFMQAENTLQIEADLTATEPAGDTDTWFGFGMYEDRIYAIGAAGLTIGDDVTFSVPEATSVFLFGGMEETWQGESMGDADADMVIGDSVEFDVDELLLTAGVRMAYEDQGYDAEPGEGRVIGVENVTFRGAEGGDTRPDAVFILQGPAPGVDMVPSAGQFPGGMDGLTLGIGALSPFEVDSDMATHLSVPGLEAILASPEITLSAPLELGALEVAADKVTFDGADVTTTGSQGYCFWGTMSELDYLLGRTDPAIVLEQSAVLTADGEVVFDGALDSGEGLTSDLTVAADDTVRLMHAVGREAPLGDLEIDAAGEDIHLQGQEVTTAGSQTYHGTLKLAADTVVEGSGIDFDGQVVSTEAVEFEDGAWEPIGEDSIARSLRVYDDGTTDFRDDVLGLASIWTDAAGTTRLHADMDVGAGPTPGAAVFNDPVILAEDVAITDAGADGIFFNNTVDSESGPVSLTLKADTDYAGPDLPVVSFAADVGGSEPLSELLINTDGRPEVPSVATIVAARRDEQGNVVDDPAFEIAFDVDEFQAGLHEKFTILGSLEMEAESVVLGDVSATGSVDITAPTDITFLRRQPGDVLMADGWVWPDDGLDIIVGNDLTLTGPVTFGGDGPEAIVISVTGGITGVEEGTPNMTIGNLSQMPVLLAAGRVLDASTYEFTEEGIFEELRAADPPTLPHRLRMEDVLGTAFSDEEEAGGGDITDDYSEGRLPDNR